MVENKSKRNVEVIKLPDNKISTLLRLCREKGIEVDEESLAETIEELELVE